MMSCSLIRIRGLLRVRVTDEEHRPFYRSFEVTPSISLLSKHCGAQPTWSIGLELLYKKSGSKEPLRNFRIAIKKLTESNHLPDYRLRFNAEEDKLTVYLRSHKGGLRELKDVLHLI